MNLMDLPPNLQQVGAEPREVGAAVTFVSGISRRRTSALRILFFTEMALSPFVAGLALLVPVAADWGEYKYVPAGVWGVLFLQCLITFRWRGLWFLVGPPVAFVAIEAYLVSLHAARSRTAPAISAAEPPLITDNPDGTFTIQKQPPKGSEGSQNRGLVIPPQVVVPEIPAPRGK